MSVHEIILCSADYYTDFIIKNAQKQLKERLSKPLSLIQQTILNMQS